METHVSLECGAEFATHAAVDEHVRGEHMGFSTTNAPAGQA